MLALDSTARPDKILGWKPMLDAETAVAGRPTGTRARTRFPASRHRLPSEDLRARVLSSASIVLLVPMRFIRIRGHDAPPPFAPAIRAASQRTVRASRGDRGQSYEGIGNIALERALRPL